MNKYRTHNCSELSEKNIGIEIKLSGWIHRKRDHGNLLFIDLRDHFGITQCVIENKDKNEHVNSFVSGLAIAIFNPKVIIFFSSIFSQFINNNITSEKIIIFTSIATLIDFTVYSAIVIFITLAIKTQTIFKNLKQINKLSGCTLILIGMILFFVI